MLSHNRVFIVPESFLRVQWTRLRGGEPPPEFVERINRLLTPATTAAFAPAGVNSTLGALVFGFLFNERPRIQ
jgi:hypothetical protein